MKRIKENVLYGYKSNSIAISTVITVAVTYGFALLVPNEDASKILLENKELIISSLSAVVLGLIFGVKK
jgi:hypothetical protein